MHSTHVKSSTSDQVAALQDAIRQKRQELDAYERQLEDLLASPQLRPDQLEPNGSAQDTYHHDINTSRTQRAQQFCHEEYQRYGRQLILPEIGPKGQASLRNARVLIVGVGGLGCPAAAYLAGAGIGTIGLIDGDTVDTSNLHRQIIHSTERVGMSKVESATQYLKSLNHLVTYKSFAEHLSPEQAIATVEQFDLVLDCTDHPTSRYLISDACVLTGKSLVSASALKTDGQLIVLNHPPQPPGDNTGGPCYRCIFPKPPPAESLVSCGEGGILGPVVGVMGVLQALEAIKLLCVQPCAAPPKPQLLMFTGFSTPQFRSIRMRTRRVDCAACSAKASITKESLTSGSVDYVAFCGISRPVEVLDAQHRTNPKAIANMSLHSDVVVIDTRESIQYDICSLKHSINIPWTGDDATWGKQALQNERLQHAKDVYVICRLGNDSQLAANALLKQGHFRQVRDIKGGFRAWRAEVDPEWPDY